MTEKNAISTMHPDAYLLVDQGNFYIRRGAFAYILEDTGEIAVTFRKALYPVVGVNDRGDEVFVIADRTLARDKNEGSPMRVSDLMSAGKIAALRKKSELSKSMGARLKDVLL